MAKAVTKTYAMPVQISKMEDGGYRAECTILQGCFVDGDTLEEVFTDIQEAMALYIEASRERGLPLEVADKQERTFGANLSCGLPAPPEGWK